MRKLIPAVLVLAMLAPAPAVAHDADIARARRVAFPKLLDGRSVLAVDLHTHSVFSDGSVWPDVRVEEAKRAFQVLNGKEFMGRPMWVNGAKSAGPAEGEEEEQAASLS